MGMVEQAAGVQSLQLVQVQNDAVRQGALNKTFC